MYELNGLLLFTDHGQSIGEEHNGNKSGPGPAFEKGGARTKKGVNVSQYFPFSRTFSSPVSWQFLKLKAPNFAW